MLTGPENDRQPVEAANIIIPADNTALDYTINLESLRGAKVAPDRGRLGVGRRYYWDRTSDLYRVNEDGAVQGLVRSNRRCG